MTRFTLYHGTAMPPFTRFEEEFIGKGWEGNSSLGVWLSTHPGTACCYMKQGRVLVVKTPALKLAYVDDRDHAINGGPDLLFNDTEISHFRYRKLREQLRAAGFDGLWCELHDEDMKGAVCVFDPDRLEIVGEMDEAEVMHLLETWDDPEEDGMEVDFTFDVTAVLAEIITAHLEARKEWDVPAEP